MRISIGDLLFDATMRRLTTRDGRGAALTPKASQLLEALVDAAPEAIAHEAIYDRLWPDSFVEPGNLHNLVAELRRASGDAGFIRTVHRFGYALRDAARVEPRTMFSLAVGEIRVELDYGETVVGRGQLPFGDVSRRHARVIVDATGVEIEDLSSKNGTFVNSVRIERSPLRVADELVLGRTRARLVANAGDTTITASRPVSGSRESTRDR